MEIIIKRLNTYAFHWRVVGEDGKTVIDKGMVCSGVENNKRLALKKAQHALRMVSK